MSGWGEFERFICASTRNHARSRGFKEGCHQHTCPVDHIAALCACSQARSAARAVLTLHSSHASFFSPNHFHAMVSCHQCHPRHHAHTHTYTRVHGGLQVKCTRSCALPVPNTTWQAQGTRWHTSKCHEAAVKQAFHRFEATCTHRTRAHSTCARTQTSMLKVHVGLNPQEVQGY